MENFLNDSWPVIAGILFAVVNVVVNVVQFITEHHSTRKGWLLKALFIIIERTAVMTSKNVINGMAGRFKAPLSDTRPEL